MNILSNINFYWGDIILMFWPFFEVRQDLETGCPKLTVVKFLGIQILRGTKINYDFNHKHE